MTIKLTFQDFAKLATYRIVEKDGVTISFDRPVLSEVSADVSAKTGKVTFFLDETDDHR